jgi:hypothetical protein
MSRAGESVAIFSKHDFAHDFNSLTDILIQHGVVWESVQDRPEPGLLVRGWNRLLRIAASVGRRVTKLMHVTNSPK